MASLNPITNASGPKWINLSIINSTQSAEQLANDLTAITLWFHHHHRHQFHGSPTPPRCPALSDPAEKASHRHTCAHRPLDAIAIAVARFHLSRSQHPELPRRVWRCQCYHPITASYSLSIRHVCPYRRDARRIMGVRSAGRQSVRRHRVPASLPQTCDEKKPWPSWLSYRGASG